MNVSAGTVVDVLRSRAAAQPEQVGYSFVKDGTQVAASLTYAELDHRARCLAALLQRRVAPGSRALLLFPPGLTFVEAYFGCLYAGVVAVPGYPPQGDRLDSRMTVICADAGASVALVPAEIRDSMAAQLERAGLPGLDCMAPPGPDPSSANGWKETRPAPQSLAHLQYTSGSTSSPKGVMVSHANLMHNCHGFQHTVPIDDDGAVVSWLPTFHDMGLVYGVLAPLLRGVPSYLMAPLEFVQRPMRWLQALSHFRATHSVGPNFAYDLCVRRVRPEDLAALDLSRWQVALNGAEPVRQATLRSFASTFEPCGFRWETFSPGFGLAECTLLVGCVRRGVGPVSETLRLPALERYEVVPGTPGRPDSRTLVGLGPPAPETELAIADPSSLRRCGPAEVGELWISGPSVAGGYWNRPEETEATFHAQLAGEPGRTYLRTGDLGFIKDGQLYIAGRIKDLIIVRGENHYPDDIEETAGRSHDQLRASGGAAFSIEVEGEERLVLVQEVKSPFADLEEIRTSIRQAVAEEHELNVHDVLFVRPGALPRTSSGKLQRHACRKAYLEGSFEPVSGAVR